MAALLILLPLSIFAISGNGQISEKSEIDQIFTDWDQDNTPGCGLGIIKNGALVYARGYGMANLEYDIPAYLCKCFDDW